MNSAIAGTVSFLLIRFPSPFVLMRIFMSGYLLLRSLPAITRLSKAQSGSPYPQNVTSGKSEKSNSSIAFAISSAVGSDLCVKAGIAAAVAYLEQLVLQFR